MLWGATRLTAGHDRFCISPSRATASNNVTLVRDHIRKNSNLAYQLCDRTAKTCDGAATLVDKNPENLKSIAHCLLKVGAIVPAERQLFAVLKNDSILAVKPRL